MIITNIKILNYFNENNETIDNFLLRYIEIDKHIKNSIENTMNNSVLNKNIEIIMNYTKKSNKKLDNIIELCEDDSIIDDDSIDKIESLIIKNNNLNNNYIIDKLQKDNNNNFNIIQQKIDNIKLLIDNNNFDNNDNIIDKLKIYFNEINNNINNISHDKTDFLNNIELLFNKNNNFDKFKNYFNNINNIENKIENIKTFINNNNNNNNELFNNIKNDFNDINNNILNISHNKDTFLNNIELLFEKNNNSKLISSIEHNISKNNDTLNYINNNSARKGQYGEKILEDLLHKEFTSSEIINKTNKISHEGDFHLYYKNKPKILIECKYYENSVDKKSVDKFIYDCKINNMSGILISMNSGISNKTNFSFEIINNNVLIYVHKLHTDSSKIRFAVNVIYNLVDYINNHPNNNISNININDSQYKSFQTEYSNFIFNFNNHINNIKYDIDQLSKCNLNLLASFLQISSNTHNLKSNFKFNIQSNIISNNTKYTKCNKCNKEMLKNSLNRHIKLNRCSN